jgi:MscS family membrane protein
MKSILEWSRGLAEASGLGSWVFATFLIVLIALLLDFIQRKLMKRLGRVVADTENSWDDALFHAAVRPLSLLIWTIGISMAVQVIPAREEDALLGPQLVTHVRQVGVLSALTWFLVSFIQNIENNIIEFALNEKRPIDKTTVHALGRVVRITILVTAGLVGLDILGFNVTGLMAAGGIGGFAVGFAAKDLLANFFGGLTVFVDRPFGIGDWIIIKDNGIEGVVEDIGWRQTCIRKFDKRPVYVPNSVFTTASVENPSRMTHRRIYETIGLRYDDAGLVGPVLDEVRDMLRNHPEIDDGQTLMVNFNAFGPSSLDFFIYCMTHTVVWQKYHEIKQDVLLRISDIITRHGASIAFPTQTIKLDTSPELAGLSGDSPAGVPDDD